MTAALLAMALTLGAAGDRGGADAISLCEVPSDCGTGGVCVDFVCRSGADQGLVRPLYVLAVAPPVVSGRPGAVDREAEALHAQLIADLQWSGMYTVTAPDKLPATARGEGASPSEVRRTVWQGDGVYRVIQVAMAPAARAGHVRARIRAVEIERYGRVELPEGDVTVPASELRAVSAAWVNALIGHDTGLRGAVGTRLVGSAEVAPGVKEIVTIDIDGRDYRQETNDGSLNLHPAWGPGGKLGWMSYKSGNPDWVVDGKPLSTRPGLNAAGAWSPDGKVLALSVAEPGDSEIVLLDGATGEEHARVTDDRAVDTSPAWSPDGQWIAFVSDRTGKPAIWLLSRRRGTLEQLTKDGYSTSPDFSPNGKSLAFIRQVGGSTFAIMRYDFDTQQTVRLTDGRQSAESPSFSPDGRYIAYSVKGSAGSSLWIMNADGSNQRQVDPRSFLSPDWRKR